MRFRTLALGATVATFNLPPRFVGAQALSELDRDRGRVMLRHVRADLERHYFDTTYGGVDVGKRFDSAARRIERATSVGEVLGIIAQALVDIDDSHTVFLPPERAARVRFGWKLLAIGDSVFVAAVRQGGSADRAGLRPGDRLVAINGVTPTRRNLWKLLYVVELLRPQVELRVVAEDTLHAQRDMRLVADVEEQRQRLDLSRDGDRRDIDLDAADREQRRRGVIRHRPVGDVLVWRLEAFSLDPDEVDARLRGLKRYRAAVLDLRGNPGGRVTMLARLVGHLLPGKIVISTGHTRRSVDTVWSRPVRAPYEGRLVVLIDSRSASAAEILARVLQLNSRATVIGDRSAGAVVVSRVFAHTAGAVRVVPFGSSITVMDVRMADGSRLEKLGVMPDDIVRPTAADLATGRDPALARALSLLGLQVSAEEAGRFFSTEPDP